MPLQTQITSYTTHINPTSRHFFHTFIATSSHIPRSRLTPSPNTPGTTLGSMEITHTLLPEDQSLTPSYSPDTLLSAQTRIQGVMVQLKDVINTMMEKLGQFAKDITRVSQEVGKTWQTSSRSRRRMSWRVIWDVGLKVPMGTVKYSFTTVDQVVP
ncbi:hypothetical protein BYT27DRAFT_7219215 [Phlegmacium glaucopus]|nr:hypothetical protein BYT27DRAFT_7219215 [Phlegmacium glaucopus]